METHVKVLAILFLILGGLCLLGAMAILVIAGGVASLVGLAAQEPEAWVAAPLIGLVGAILFVVLLILSLPAIAAGVGLLKYRPWARILGLILSVLNLVNFPIGTVVGVYGLWVLLSTETERLFTAWPASPPAPP